MIQPPRAGDHSLSVCFRMTRLKKKTTFITKSSFKIEPLGFVTADLLTASSSRFNFSEHLPLKALILPNNEIPKNKTPKATRRGR